MTEETSPLEQSIRSQAGDASQERRKRRYVANLAFGAIKAQHAAHRSTLERLVDWLNEVASSTAFLVAHGLAFTIWILWNTGHLGIRPIDPFPFGLMTTIVSLEPSSCPSSC
jgi:uncharacterized membrane protein